MELDERYADVIVKRYIEQKGSDTDVTLLRDGKPLLYSDLVNEVVAHK